MCDDDDGSSVFSLLPSAIRLHFKGPNTEVVGAVDQVTPAQVYTPTATPASAVAGGVELLKRTDTSTSNGIACSTVESVSTLSYILFKGIDR